LIDNARLLEETCDAALTILPCEMAWLLIANEAGLFSRAMACAKGKGTPQVFLRLFTGGLSEQPVLPLVPGANPIVDALLEGRQHVNTPLEQIKALRGGDPLHRALSQMRTAFVHFLPLHDASHNPLGVFVLAAEQAHDTDSPRGQQLLSALVSHAATVVENTRMATQMIIHEEQMRIEQAFRKMVLDTMAESLIVIDDEANIRYVNNRLLTLSGYTRKDLYGYSVGSIFHPDGRETLVKNLRRGGRGTVSFNQQLVTRSGRVVPVLMSRATAPSVELKGQSTVLVLSDLTDQKLREQALEQQSERLRALNRAAQTIASAGTLDAVLDGLLQSAIDIVGGVSVGVFLPERDSSGTFRAAKAKGPQASTMMKATARENEALISQFVQARQAQIVLNVEETRGFLREGDDVLGVPMISADQVVGILIVVNRAEGLFGQEDVEVLENLAAAAAVAIERTRLLDQMQRRVSELSTLLEASATVSSTLEIGSVLEMITRDLRDTLKIARCAIASWDRESQQLVTLAAACNAYWSPGQGPERVLASMLFSTGMLRTQRVLVARQNDPGLNIRVRNQLDSMGMSSLMLAPLRFSPTVAGVIELYKARGQNAFTAHNLQSVEDMIPNWGEQNAGIITERWRGFENLTDLALKLIQASKASWCVISIWDRRDRKAHALCEIGFATWTEESGTAYKITDYPTVAQSLAHGMPITLAPALLHNDQNERDLLTRSGTPTGLVTPLMVRGEAIGLVRVLDTNAARSFDLAEISLCQGIANVVGSALENAQLYRSLEKRAAALQLAYNQLQESDRLKDNLIQSLSHELKTPLHKISMQLELLAQEALGPLNPEQRAGMQTLIDWSTQLGALVNGMVSLHALDVQEMQFKPVRLEAIIDQTIQKAHSRNKGNGRMMVADLPPDLPPVRADPVRLAEVLDQLVDNAIKFSPDSDRIEIRVTDDGSPMIHVSVRDYGIGIPPAEFERIFTRGYQVDSSLTRRFGGAGLGLAITRRIVEKHGGTIWVESAFGQGSKFHFTVPRWQAE
jgi:PAS domain S-box-containing protein